MADVSPYVWKGTEVCDSIRVLKGAEHIKFTTCHYRTQSLQSPPFPVVYLLLV